METSKRYELPFLKDPNAKFSVWKILKDAIGKDLTKFCVPVYFNEPLSMDHKVAEIMNYEVVLVQANRCNDSSQRSCMIAAFCAGQYCCTIGRVNKPFNPILGETFELLTDKYKYVAE